MSKKTKLWLFIAAALVVLGCIVFGSALAMANWDFENLSTTDYADNTYTVTEAFHDISIEAFAQVKILPATDGKVSVSCHEMEKCKHTVSVVDGTLTVTGTDQRRWQDYIGIHFGTPTVTVALPNGDYGEAFIKTATGDVKVSKEVNLQSLEIKTTTGDVHISCTVPHFIRVSVSTGDILVENAAMKMMNLRTGTGDITVKDVQCQERLTVEITTGDIRMTDVAGYGIHMEGSTGDLLLQDISCDWLETKGTTGDATLKNVVTKTQITVGRSTGDVKLEKCDSAGIDIATSTGDVTGTLLTRKKFYAKTKTGKVDVPLGGETMGNCSVITSTGDIKIEIEE